MALLYSLRYERHASNEIASVIDKLSSLGVRGDLAAEEACRARAVRRSRPRDAPHRWRAPAHQLVASLNRYAGAAQRQGDLFLNENMLSRSKAVLKKGLKVRVRNTSSTRARSFLMRPCP